MDGVAAYRVRFRCNTDGTQCLLPPDRGRHLLQLKALLLTPGERTLANEPRNDAVFCKVVHSGRWFVLLRNRPVVDSPHILEIEEVLFFGEMDQWGILLTFL
ncbi:hypothetical protein CDAR_105381 [Caerostris darwini]|uniref:Uncharacterized protein n=1 Tax=Caerostris darwini TaxID=1538125 RepID=A0AAV4SMF2_9ARAC|nr:hypothetical protein CDAR_105381 [Caerostris darwini]